MSRIMVFLALLLCQNINAQSFVLNGAIKDSKAGYVILKFRDIHNTPVAKIARITNGKFRFKGQLNGIADAILATDSNNIYRDKKYYRYLYLEPGVLNISFKMGEINNATYTGSRTQIEYEALEKSKEEDNIKLKYQDSLRSLIKAQLKQGATEQNLKEVDKRYKEIARGIMKKEILFIKKNPKSYISLTLIKDLVSYISNDSIQSLYSSISAKVKGSSLDYVFLEYYSRYRKAISAEYPFDKLAINSFAPSFSIYNILTNDSLTLSDLKGKTVLLEFWGLECLPCLRENPVLEEIRKKYNKDEFVIIGITETPESKIPELISYIEKNKFSDWVHVISNRGLKSRNNSIHTGNFENFTSLGVPRTVLIDKNGKLIYKNEGYSPEDIEKIKLLIGKEISD